LGVRAGGVAILRVYCAGDESLAALAAVHAGRHDEGLGQSCGPVIVGGVGRFHTSEVADKALILEYGLQSPLADFRLVRGVSGVELASHEHMLHDAGDEVVVGAGAKEAGVLIQVGVAVRQGGHLRQYLRLAEGSREVKAGEPLVGRHVGKELFRGGHPDGVQHGPSIGRSMRNERHGATPARPAARAVRCMPRG